MFETVQDFNSTSAVGLVPADIVTTTEGFLVTSEHDDSAQYGVTSMTSEEIQTASKDALLLLILTVRILSRKPH